MDKNVLKIVEIFDRNMDTIADNGEVSREDENLIMKLGESLSHESKMLLGEHMLYIMETLGEDEASVNELRNDMETYKNKHQIQ